MTANNLANVNTTGYKKDNLSFKDTFVMFAHDQMMEPVATVRSDKLFPEPMHMARPRIAVSHVDFQQGAMRQTGGNLDMAIGGDGFFKLQTPQGEVYTRNGQFQVTSEGLLTNNRGEPVLGQGGEIAIPPNARVVVNEAGEICADGELVDQFQIATVEDLTALEKAGGGGYRLREGSLAQEIPAEDAVVNQGYLEASNVNVVEEMVNMIETHRAFEAYQKVITTSKETDDKLIQKIGTVR
jgi:flagellar basal-body rod protein FlgG